KGGCVGEIETFYDSLRVNCNSAVRLHGAIHIIHSPFSAAHDYYVALEAQRLEAAQTKSRETHIGNPSDDDWYWYNHLLNAGAVQNGKLKGNGRAREMMLLPYLLKHCKHGPTNVKWFSGWRDALSAEKWRANTKNFFENKVKICFAW